MPIKFGLQVPSFTFTNRKQENIYRVAESIAQTAEEVGFDSFWFMDHIFQNDSVALETDPILECWTGIAAIAAATRRIKIGTLTTCNQFRQPSLLAKIGATVDVVSNGRLIMGIGAGWWEKEHRAYGIPFYPTGERLQRLEESIQIIKAMWTQEQATFIGRHYQVKDALCSPKPVQKPHPPFLVGGGGEKVTLRIVAKYAAMSNLAFGTPELIRGKVEVLRQHCKNVGRNPGEIVVSMLCPVVMGRDQRDVERKISALPGAPAQERARKRGLTGTPQQITEGLKRLVEAGVSYFVVSFPDPDDLTSIRAFTKEVVPAFA